MKEARSKATNEKEWWEAWLEEWREAAQECREFHHAWGEAWEEWRRRLSRVLEEGTKQEYMELMARKPRLEQAWKKALAKLEEVERKGRERLGMED